MGMTGALLIGVVVFMLLFPTWLLFSELWSFMSPTLTPALIGSNQGSTLIHNLGNTVFYYIPDTMLTIMYFALLMAFFLSALYENSRPETLPIGLLFLIPLILVTFPLSDFTHAFYTNPGFANVAQYYTSIEYISDWAPLFTTISTLAYIVFLVTKKQVFQDLPSGSGIISG